MAREGLHLVITAFDIRQLRAVDEVFARFPVRIGRGSGNDVRLTARSVSRHHGVFTYQPGSMLQYTDLGSRHGTCVDGIRIEPMEPVSLRDCNIIEISHYQLTFRLQHGRPRADRPITAPLPVLSGPPEVSLWKATLARSEAIRLVRAEHGPSDLLRRAAEVIELLAEMLVLFRRSTSSGRSMLWSSRAPDEITAYLLSPAGGERALRELRDMLTDLFMATAHIGAPS